MLISITNKCRMNCTHCMDDAKESSNDFMSLEDFYLAIDFNFKYDRNIIITGGEPTEHPLFWQFISILNERLDSKDIATVTTNGMNLNSPSIYDGIKNFKKNLIFQITHDDRYYKKPIDLDYRLFTLPNVVLVKDVNYIYPQGRALNIGAAYFTKAPKCFNFRSIVRSTKDFKDSIDILRFSQKFCTPQISHDLYLKCGESILCPNVVKITEKEDVIIDKICKFRCSGCPISKAKLTSKQLKCIED